MPFSTASPAEARAESWRRAGVAATARAATVAAAFALLAAAPSLAQSPPEDEVGEAARPVAPAPAPPPAVVTDLAGLLAGMRSSVGVVAQFTETKELALLSAPLEAAGTIYFVPPDRLVRVVTRPGPSRLVVDGDRVRVEDGTGSRTLDLGASPVARQLVDSFVVLFNGDEARLRQLYDCSFRAEGEAWSLHLVPRAAPLDRMIASLDLAGTGPRIDRMVTTEPDGDRTVAVFGDTDVQHRFGEEELAALFPASAPQ